MKTRKSIFDIANMLLRRNNFYILTHKSPDGDTIGSAFALFYALKKKGRKVRVFCEDPFPEKYEFFINLLNNEENFEPHYIISVDVADTILLGENLEKKYERKVDMCIDHHASNKYFAKVNYIEPSAAATTEIIYDIIKNLKVRIDRSIAECIYMGITTDTGSFRHTNVTAKTHRIAAKCIELGARHNLISRKMFDIKSTSRIKLECVVMENIELYYKDKCAIAFISKDMLEQTGTREEETGGIASMTRQIEGVLVGVTIRERENGEYKLSLRSGHEIDVQNICAKFGGGGHPNASGCTMTGSIKEIKNKILKELEFLENYDSRF